MLPNLGGWEWVIIAVVALILFGGARLANFGKNAGKAIREFKEETSSLKKADPPAVEAPPAQPEPEGIVHEGEIVPEPKDKGQQA